MCSFIFCASQYKYHIDVLLSGNISENPIAGSILGKLTWYDSHLLCRRTTDPLEHVVESRILCFEDTIKLMVAVPNDVENLGAHKVHKRKVSIPKYILALNFSKKIKMHVPILFIEDSQDLEACLEFNHMVHFRRGYGLAPTDLGF